MSSSRRTRQRRQQKSLERHHLRLEGLEKRYALDASPVLDADVYLEIPASFRHRDPYEDFTNYYGGYEFTPIAVNDSMTMPVSNLIGEVVGNYDASSGGLYGIAITNTEMRHGKLLYTTDGGVSWQNVGPVSPQSALLLSVDSSNQLFYHVDYFDPQALPLAESFSFRAWNGSDGNPSGTRFFNTTNTPVVQTSSLNFPDYPNFSTDGNLFVTLSGGYDYQLNKNVGLLEVFDSTNPYLPVLVDSISWDTLQWNRNAGDHVKFAGDYACIFHQRQLSVLDLSIPSQARIINTIDLPWTMKGNLFLSTDEQWGYIYGLNNVDVGAPLLLRKIDFSDPLNIVIGENEMDWIDSSGFGPFHSRNKNLVTSVSKELVFSHGLGSGTNGSTPPEDAYRGIRVYSLATKEEVHFEKEYTDYSTELFLNKQETQLFAKTNSDIKVYDIADSGELTPVGQLPYEIPFGETIYPEVSDQYLLVQLTVGRNDIYAISNSGMPQFIGRAEDGAAQMIPGKNMLLTSVYPNDYVQVINQETVTGSSAISSEEAVVQVAYNDSEATFFGSETGVIDTGRTARGEVLWKDSDNFKHPYGDSGRFLSASIEGASNYQNVLTSAIVVANGTAGHATVSTSFSTTETRNGRATAHVFSTQWFYDAGYNFGGSDSFTIRFFDELGGYTDKVITVTGEPSQSIGLLANMAVHQNQSGSLASYSLPAVGVQGESLSGGIARITATSSNQALIADPTTIYTSQDIPSSISFTPAAGLSGSATISMQIEDGGADNNLATAHDNGHATHQIEVNVLEVISNQGSAILAKDSSESLYVNTQPVIYNQQQVPEAIFGSSVVSADTSDSENALMLKPLGADAEDPPTHRLLTDETWRINGIFNSLQNASSPVLDLSGREVSGTLNIAAVAGAYVINGVNNPTLVVRRGQTYTFNLNTAGHPFWLQTTGNGHQEANSYSDGFTGNSQTTGEHQWIVPVDAPDEIFYQCEFHPVMFGKIIVVD